MNKLYHVYDPMCAWCWAYQPAWGEIKEALKDKVKIVYVLGGLARDSDVPMPDTMQKQISGYWKNIENKVGTQFNHDFWTNNTPRRSTYPSCRAVLAARTQGEEESMLTAIQHAYYLNALNPSDNDVLIGLAKQIDLDVEKFTKQFLSEQNKTALLNEIKFARSIGGNSFPSLFIEIAQDTGAVAKEQKDIYPIQIDYLNASKTIEEILNLNNQSLMLP